MEIGRSYTAISTNNIRNVHQMVLDDRKFNIRQITDRIQGRCFLYLERRTNPVHTDTSILLINNQLLFIMDNKIRALLGKVNELKQNVVERQNNS